MTVVYKHRLDADRVTETKLPRASRPIAAGIQDQHLVTWVRHTDDPHLVSYRFYVLMTGETLEAFLAQYGKEGDTPDSMVHLETLLDNEIGLVYHVFYVTDH